MNKIIKNACFFLCLLLVASCSNGKKQLTGEELVLYKKTISLSKDVERMLRRVTSLDYDQATQLLRLSEQLNYTYDPFSLDSASVAKCEELQQSLEYLQDDIYTTVAKHLSELYVPVAEKEDYLVENKVTYPVYLKRGDKLFAKIQCKNPATVKVYNYNSKATLKTLSGKTNFDFNLPIENSAIYLLEFNPGSTAQYADIAIAYTAKKVEGLIPVKVHERTVEAKQGDFLAWSTPGIEMVKIFDEPRKFTLRGQFKAAFSGTYRGVVPIQIPAGATDILYSMRISTNEADRSTDGKFEDNMNSSYRRIKILGMPVYESNKSSGIIKTILGDYTPLREEDAYINMYVFNNASHAKKFNDRNTDGNIIYDINHSIMGMQSSNGRIPVKGKSVIYLGFENERTRYANYVWIEVLASKPIKEYFKTEYYLD